MLTLSLFRHAKSSWDDAAMKDLDRPLAERGRAAAPVMGAYLAKEGLLPDLVLSSPSVRTRATCALAFSAFQSPPMILFEDVLYLASLRTLLGRIRRAENAVRHLMVVGHNPGLHELALELIGHAPKKPLAELAAKLPTGGLVVLEFDSETWADAGPEKASLARFVTPRMLMR